MKRGLLPEALVLPQSLPGVDKPPSVGITQTELLGLSWQKSVRSSVGAARSARSRARA